MIDMGEIGCFNRNQLENILNEIKDEYQIVGTPRGIIVGRGYEGENFQRIMEIQIPIALKHCNHFNVFLCFLSYFTYLCIISQALDLVMLSRRIL